MEPCHSKRCSLERLPLPPPPRGASPRRIPRRAGSKTPCSTAQTGKPSAHPQITPGARTLAIKPRNKELRGFFMPAAAREQHRHHRPARGEEARGNHAQERTRGGGRGKRPPHSGLRENQWNT